MKLPVLLRSLFRTRPAHLRSGEWGERQAAKALRRHGLSIIGTRVRVGSRDEIDIVARDDATLVFVEVKTRADEAYGRAFSALDGRKKKALRRAARRYLGKLREKPEYFRFDVVEVIGSPGEGAPVIRHIPNAMEIGMRWA